MLRAFEIRAAGTWHEPPADSIHLDHLHRHRRRLLLRTEAGEELLLDLAEATRLRDGDALCLADGRLVAIRARPEPVMILTAPPHLLLRLAWHLGNRHLPVQILPAALHIQADHVIAAMAENLGATVTEATLPFDPEPGAYAAAPHAHR